MKGAITWQKPIEHWPFGLPDLEIDPGRTALLVVDMSNQQQPTITKALPNTVKLRDFFRQSGLPVIYLLVGSLLPDGRDGNIKRRLTWMRKAGAPPFSCPKGSREYQLREELTPLANEPVIDKNTSGAFNSSNLDTYLRAFEVQNLVVAGIATSHCVESTARDAADRGYNVILVDDACADSDETRHQVTVTTFARLFGAVKTTEETITDISRLLAVAN
ncbi:MAG: cysteine hydrolase [Chloroflexi bacterium]|nr:cysteine hydrolase [Chloroflexota bacterium]